MSPIKESGFKIINEIGDDLEKIPLHEEETVDRDHLKSLKSVNNVPEVAVDSYNLVYLIFLLHGIGTLMPWNMFITAQSYFTDYKFGKEYVGEETMYATSFLQYLTFASQIPNLIFNWLNVFIEFGGNRSARVAWSIVIEIAIFILTVILAMLNTHSWPGILFWITMVSVVILNMVNGIYQNTIYGMAAKLPPKYTGAIILGTNISGTFAAIVSILSTSFTPNPRLSAIYYFITALFVLLACFNTYFALPLNKFYRHYKMKEAAQMQTNQTEKYEKTPYFYIFKKVFPQLFNIFFIFFVTLSVFPAVQANVRRISPNFIVSEKYFTPVTCFLTFGIGATFGSYLPTLVIWPKPKYLIYPVLLRVFYIPFFLFSNYHVGFTTRVLPILITNDWVYWIIAITLGITGGYFSSLGMMYAPRIVEEKYSGTAGMFAGAALGTGLFSGILLTFVWPALIENVTL